MITLTEALGDAQRKRIAIGHFNVSDLVALKALYKFLFDLTGGGNWLVDVHASS
jgi:hypothetical protein